MAVNPLAKSNINPITVAMGETEVEKNIAITNNGPFDMYEPLTKTSVAAGATETVLVQGDDFRAEVLANLDDKVLFDGFDSLSIIVSNPENDAWSNVLLSNASDAGVDAAEVTFTGLGSGGKASFNNGKAAGKWALNMTVSGMDTAGGDTINVGFLAATADSSDLSAAVNLVSLTCYLNKLAVVRLGASSVSTKAVLATKTIPASVTIAVFVDIDAGTWGVVDDAGVAHTDVGALTNANGVSPSTVGGITASLKLYPFVAAVNGGANADFAPVFELLDANITGVPVGYTALTAA